MRTSTKYSPEVRERAVRLVYPARRGVQRKWRAPPRHWHQVRAELAIRFGERFVVEGS